MFYKLFEKKCNWDFKFSNIKKKIDSTTLWKINRTYKPEEKKHARTYTNTHTHTWHRICLLPRPNSSYVHAYIHFDFPVHKISYVCIAFFANKTKQKIRKENWLHLKKIFFFLHLTNNFFYWFFLSVLLVYSKNKGIIKKKRKQPTFIFISSFCRSNHFKIKTIFSSHCHVIHNLLIRTHKIRVCMYELFVCLCVEDVFRRKINFVDAWQRYIHVD